jgi:putative redox protein
LTSNEDKNNMPRNVSVSSGLVKYAQSISIGPHQLQSDEPSDVGGKDIGPNPQELLMASLGACASTTVQMYAERHQWPLKGVRVTVSQARVMAENLADSGAKIGMVDQLEMEFSFTGDLAEEQRSRLLEIAGHCPIHRMLTSEVKIYSRLMPDASSQ